MSLLFAAANEIPMMTSLPLLGAFQRPFWGVAAIAVCAAAFMFGYVMLVLRQFKRCPPNRAMVIYGRTSSHGSTTRVLHGGAAFVVPLLQDYGYLSLEPIQVEVPARLVGKLRQGEKVMAKLDRGGNLFQASVDRIFPMAAQGGGHTTTVKFGIPADIKAQVGTYAEIMLQDDSLATTGQPLIPISAIVWRGSLPAVFVVTDDGNLKMRTLRTGSQSGDGMISVITGVKEGDRILKNPTASTKSGPMG